MSLLTESAPGGRVDVAYSAVKNMGFSRLLADVRWSTVGLFHNRAYICREQVSHRVPDACKRVAGLHEKEEKNEKPL